MNILQVPYNEMPYQLDTALLDHLTSEEVNRGKRTEEYWILKSDTNILQDPNQKNMQAEQLNRLLFETARRGFTSLMIMK